MLFVTTNLLRVFCSACFGKWTAASWLPLVVLGPQVRAAPRPLLVTPSQEI